MVAHLGRSPLLTSLAPPVWAVALISDDPKHLSVYFYNQTPSHYKSELLLNITSAADESVYRCRASPEDLVWRRESIPQGE